MALTFFFFLPPAALACAFPTKPPIPPLLPMDFPSLSKRIGILRLTFSLCKGRKGISISLIYRRGGVR